MYREEEFLQLSGIQHFAFCRRQWALAYIELQWQENVRTVEGKLLHEKAHDVHSREKRGDVIISRAMPICSRELGVSGECDIVEFHRTDDGISLHGQEGQYEVIPVEYKRGSPKRIMWIFFSLLHRQCVWKKCFAVRLHMDIYFMERQDIGKKWILQRIFVRKFGQCFLKCMHIFPEDIHLRSNGVRVVTHVL